MGSVNINLFYIEILLCSKCNEYSFDIFLRESCFRVSENLSLMSKPYFCVKPKATRCLFLL